MCIKTLPPPKLTELEIPNQEEEENTIILSTFPQFNPKNYFHFLIEGLTRFNIVWERYKREERERKERGERERGYRVLVQGGEMHASWEGVRREALELLGVDWDKVFFCFYFLFVFLSGEGGEREDRREKKREEIE